MVDMLPLSFFPLGKIKPGGRLNSIVKHRLTGNADGVKAITLRNCIYLSDKYNFYLYNVLLNYAYS